MNVLSISASISVTSAYILTQFGTEQKCHTINTSEWPNSHNLKIQDGGGRHLEFRKKMLITPDWIKISAPNFMWRCITVMRIWPLTKGRNRKLLPVMSSNERLKHKCVDLSYYNRYLNQIWYRSQISHCLHAGMVKFTTSKIQYTGCRHFGFLGYVK